MKWRLFAPHALIVKHTLQLCRVFIRREQPLCLPLGPSGLGKCKDWLTGVGLSAATTLVHGDVK